MTDTDFRPIPGWEDKYLVSDAGEIYSLKYKRLLTPFLSRYGYAHIELRRSNPTIRMNRGVHRLVAAAFIGRCLDGQQVNHKNGVKTDNRLVNLEYVTSFENKLHAATVLGNASWDRKRLLEMSKRAVQRTKKLTPDLIATITALQHGGMTLKESARRCGVRPESVWRARRRLGHIT